MIRFVLNRDVVALDLPPGKPLLDVIRRQTRLTGTKEGCREGDCGACMVLLGKREERRLRYRPVNSCLLPLGEAEGCHVVTIEGLNGKGLNPLQEAFAEETAVQCGFCTPGFIVALTGFFLDSETLDPEGAIQSVGGNICRCTGYVSIRRAIRTLCSKFDKTSFEATKPGTKQRARLLIQWRIVTPYFAAIADRIRRFPTRTAGSGSGVIVAGGTDLYVQKPDEMEDADLCLLSRRSDLAGIRIAKGIVTVGAATSTEDFVKLFPSLQDELALISSWPIRVRATVGGNLVNASPIGDLAILLLALGGVAILSKGKRRREVPLRSFFKGYKKLDLKKGELLREVRFPVPSRSLHLSFEKVSRRTYLDIASVNSAAAIEVKGDRIVSAGLSAGGVAPVPLYLSKTSGFLVGKEIAPETVLRAAEIAGKEISPISDVRGSADYKRLLLRQLIFAHFLKLFPERIPEEMVA